MRNGSDPLASVGKNCLGREVVMKEIIPPVHTDYLTKTDELESGTYKMLEVG